MGYLVYLYVDDLIYGGKNVVLIDEFKKIMINEFEMIHLDLMNHFHRLEIK